MQTATHMLRTGQRGARFQFQMASRDLANSFRRLGLSWSLAWHDVTSRYRGSVLGPFWITLSMGLMVLGIGFLYASLFNLPLHVVGLQIHPGDHTRHNRSTKRKSDQTNRMSLIA